ncbi:MAG: hypothetical protein F4Z31_13635 [Gemmatimonadetes bacterium]|nr:hypothetical protein [Gemmatimonadota bacterium]MYA42778.1 hypothetical protein [Gemmatimonadota bacterium]MYE94796.1 hypothetical protein [Gemmatimonadota bacterium]MYJ10835.1 hypothetical protein [Gemmatimonadota bacterium]
MKVLLDSAVDAFHVGLAQRPNRRKDMAEAAKGLRMPSLSASERASLTRIAEHRERALSLARRGDLDEAVMAMNAARILMSLTRFSATVEPAVQSAHYAAVSYLSYRQGDYARARAEMVNALGETNRMSGDNTTLSARRVHLVHNIMKVDAASGSPTDTLKMGFRILRYLAMGPTEWPSDFGPGPQTKPNPLIAEYQSDKIVETMAGAVESLPEGEYAPYCVETKRLSSWKQPPSPRAWSWLSLKRWQFEGQAQRFLSAAASFLSAGPGATPKLWYAVALDIVVSYREYEPERAGRATETMVSAIVNSPTAPSEVRTRLATCYGAPDSLDR